MNYYPFHLGDYAAHTGHLEPLEDLAYRRMLDAYYLREAPLPHDPPEVARLIRMRQNLAEVEAVLREFFDLREAGWSHDRCTQEIERMQDKQAKARASAAASVTSRKAKAHTQEIECGTPVERTLSDRSTGVELPTPTPTPKEELLLSTQQNKEKPEAQKAKRLPNDWTLPKSWGQWTLETMGWDEAAVRTEGEKFKDYWTAKGGREACKLDWLATWRNWCRNSKTPAASTTTSFLKGGI